jgi:hypothetical protein
MKKLTWVVQGGANNFAILDGNKWVAGIQLNGEMLLAEQEAFMALLTQAPGALALCVESLDQLLPYLSKVPADVGLLNNALMAARPLLKVTE